MVFLHELGHFLAARLFKIEVEEFGFGIPPRLLRLWRARGRLTVAGQEIEIPSNFDLSFEGSAALNKTVTGTADQVNDKLVLRTLALVNSPEPGPVPAPANALEEDDLLDELRESPVRKNNQPLPQKNPVKPAQPGAIQFTGTLTRLEQGLELTLNWLPIGGFVRPKGEGDPDVPGGLAAASPWKRLGVLFAGPLMNLLTAVVVISVLIGQQGVPVPGKVLIENVSADSPAQQAGIQPRDLLVSVAGQSITTIDQARALIYDSLDQPLEMTFERNGQPVTLTATPLSTRPANQGALGIGLAYPRRAATFTESLNGGLMYTAVQAAGLLYVPIGLIRGEIASEDARLVGMKGIYDFLAQAVARDTETRQAAPAPSTGGSPAPAAEPPTNYVVSIIAMLSVSLGVINLLPIPALDGGRILFTLPEILFRRRIPPRFENTINGVAMMMLIALMLFVNLMDFINPSNIKLP